MKTQNHKSNLFKKDNNSIHKNNIITLKKRNYLRHTSFVDYTEFLFKKLVIIIFDIRKESIPIAVVLGIFLLYAKETNAQITFDPIQTNPFSLTSIFINNVGGESSVSFADLDNDGDLDMISGHFSGNHYYFQNIGTATAPNFATGVINSFGLTSTPTNGNNNTFVDLDNDGDFDIMSGVGLGDYYYYKNIGTVSNPNFSTPIINPFSLPNIAGSADNDNAFIDLDNDGDLDMMTGRSDGNFYYYENIGTASNPIFSTPIINPFSLIDIGSSASPTFADIDGDGDSDLLVGDWNTGLKYFENIGTISSPNFGPMQTNPFPVMTYPGLKSLPHFVDIDADGDADIMLGSFSGDFTFFENTSNLITSINKSNISNVNIYPNPVGNTLTIQLEKNAKNIQVSIMSIEGKLIYTKKSINNSVISIDVANWSNGIYIVKLNSIHENKTVKFIKGPQ